MPSPPPPVPRTLRKQVTIGLGTLLGGPAAAFVAAGLLRLLHLSLRKRYAGSGTQRDIHARGGNFIGAFWHSRLLMMAFLYEGPGIHVLVSSHRDGQILAGILSNLGLPAVRGSSRRGGGLALARMATLLEEGRDLGNAVDGPKGPPGIAKPGTAWLSLKTGRPVVPMAFSASRAFRFRSWDRFLVPRPFARGVWVTGEPILPREGEEVEDLRKRIEAAIREVTDLADDLAGLPDRERPPETEPSSPA